MRYDTEQINVCRTRIDLKLTKWETHKNEKMDLSTLVLYTSYADTFIAITQQIEKASCNNFTWAVSEYKDTVNMHKSTAL